MKSRFAAARPTPAQLRFAREVLAYRAPETLTERQKALLAVSFPRLVEAPDQVDAADGTWLPPRAKPR